jgi:hypothetical protein
MEANFQEYWTFNGNTYPAIAIDHEVVSSKVMMGGQYIEASTQVFVREEVFVSSGVQKGNTITARSQNFTVLSTEQEGDASRILVLGSPQLDIWK